MKTDNGGNSVVEITSGGNVGGGRCGSAVAGYTANDNISYLSILNIIDLKQK